MGKSISEVGVEDWVGARLTIGEAKELEPELRDAVMNGGFDPKEVWHSITARKLLKPWQPHALHQLFYYSVYYDYDESIHGPPLDWFPSLHQSRQTNLGHLMESHCSRLLGELSNQSYFWKISMSIS